MDIYIFFQKQNSKFYIASFLVLLIVVKTIDDFKEKFDFLAKPTCKWLSLWNIKPFHLTIASFIAGLFSIFFLYSQNALFTVFALLHLLLDKLDGSLARLTGSASQTGRWFDYITDSFILFLLLLRSYFIFPAAGASIILTNKFVLITLLLYVVLNIFQIFIKKRNTFGSHLIGILLFIFKQYQYAIVTIFIISLYGVIYHLIKK